MAMLALITLCVVAQAAFCLGADSSVEYGMDMSVRAYDAVCWYENLKVFPNTQTRKFGGCVGQAKFQADNLNKEEFFKTNPEIKERQWGMMLSNFAMNGLSDKYNSQCGQYLQDSKAEPPADESDALNDGGSKYPYRAFAYCLMKTLRDTHGTKGIDAIKNEKTYSKKDWLQALLDRENEFRARHGVDPLQLSKELTTAAQSWAETNAKECRMYHTTSEQRLFNGEQAGENLAGGFGYGTENDTNTLAYAAADGWYEEIQYYPFPDGYQGGDSGLFSKIGHFTQAMWKSSKQVGYGLAINKDCDGKGPFTSYITARYYPVGNIDGAYKENVLPPKNK